MKNKILLMMIMMIFSVAVVSAVEIPEINITLMNQIPDPVNPGQYVELRFMIFNTRVGTTAENFQVILDPQYPFYLDPNQQATQTIGDLPSYGAGKNQIIVKYKVRVDDKAVEGYNPIVLKYKHDKSEWIGKEFNVLVRTSDANLGIISVETIPKEIKPGEELKMKVKVKNMADSVLRDVTLKLDLTFSNVLGSITSTAADKIVAFNALPFAPLGSTTEQKIYSLSPGEEHIFEYNLIALSDATSQIYKVPIQISYSDEIGTSYEKNDILGVIVGTKPDLSVVLDSSDLYVGKRAGTISIKFINKGFTDIKFLDIKLAEKDEYELLSASEVYIGNVNSDDYETADFQIYLKNGAAKQEGVIKLPLTIEYRDANNRVYNDNIDINLKIMNPEKLGMQSGPNGILFFVILLLIIGGIVFFRRRKNKNKR